MEQNIQNNFQLFNTNIISESELVCKSNSILQDNYCLPINQAKCSQQFDNFLTNEALKFISSNKLSFFIFNFNFLF